MREGEIYFAVQSDSLSAESVLLMQIKEQLATAELLVAQIDMVV